jgi:hypothetical protein
VQATIFPHDDDEGVLLWFSGQRLLTDGTSENASSAHFVNKGKKSEWSFGNGRHASRGGIMVAVKGKPP